MRLHQTNTGPWKKKSDWAEGKSSDVSRSVAFCTSWRFTCFSPGREWRNNPVWNKLRYPSVDFFLQLREDLITEYKFERLNGPSTLLLLARAAFSTICFWRENLSTLLPCGLSWGGQRKHLTTSEQKQRNALSHSAALSVGGLVYSSSQCWPLRLLCDGKASVLH